MTADHSGTASSTASSINKTGKPSTIGYRRRASGSQETSESPAQTSSARVQALGVPGFFVEVEPHLKGGGQFGGYSGPDGMGVAVRSLCRLLDYQGIGYGLRTFEDIRADRGF